MYRIAIAISLSAIILASPGNAASKLTITDGYYLGAGGWTCEEINRITAKGTKSEFGQVAGWVFGAWSMATRSREKKFVDIVEKVGGNKILKLTLERCKKSPSSTRLYVVVTSMIANTNKQK